MKYNSGILLSIFLYVDDLILIYNKKELTINTLKGSFYWEVGIGKDFEFGDARIHCTQFLLDSTIQVIETNLMREY